MDYAGVVALEIVYMIAFLALISAGLAIVFGMMRVINLAHGEFVMLGGYTTIACVKADVDVYIAMLVIAPLVVGAVGLVVERLIIRWLYGRIIDTMLATWGLSLLLVGLVTLIFGTSAVSVPAPIPGYQLGSYQMGGYNLFIIGVTVLAQLMAYGLGWLSPATWPLRSAGLLVEYVAWTIGLGAAVTSLFTSRRILPPPVPV